VGPARLFAARGALRNDAITVARRTAVSKVLEMDPEHAVARHRLAAITDRANKKSRLAMASLFSKKR
jgi:hypothetical protein